MYIWNDKSLPRKNEATVIRKTGRFDNLDSAVIISCVSQAVQFCIADSTI